MAHVCEVACWASMKISWIRMPWDLWALGQGNCNISPCTDWHSCKCTRANTHTCMHTHALSCSLALSLTAHYHTHTLSCLLACSLSWHTIIHCHANKATFWNKWKYWIQSYLHTYKQKSLQSIRAVAWLCPFNVVYTMQKNLETILTNRWQWQNDKILERFWRILSLSSKLTDR